MIFSLRVGLTQELLTSLLIIQKNKIEQSNYKSIKVLTIPILHENFVRDIRKRKTKNSIKIIVVLSYLSYLYLHHDDTILNKDH